MCLCQWLCHLVRFEPYPTTLPLINFLAKRVHSWKHYPRIRPVFWTHFRMLFGISYSHSHPNVDWHPQSLTREVSLTYIMDNFTESLLKVITYLVQVNSLYSRWSFPPFMFRFGFLLFFRCLTLVHRNLLVFLLLLVCSLFYFVLACQKEFLCVVWVWELNYNVTSV